MFSQWCGEALTDTQGYIDRHPKTGPDGAPALINSPDGQVLIANRLENGVFFRIEFLGLPGRLAVLCEMEGLSGLEHTIANALLHGGHGSHGLEAAAVIPSDGVAAAVRAHFTAMDGVHISGGEIPETYGMSLGLSGGDPTYGNHIFGVQLPFAGRTAFVWASAHTSSFDLVTLNYVEAGG